MRIITPHNDVLPRDPNEPGQSGHRIRRTAAEIPAKKTKAQTVARAISDLVSDQVYEILLDAVDNRDEAAFDNALDQAHINDQSLRRYLKRITFRKSVYDAKTLEDAPFCWG